MTVLNTVPTSVGQAIAQFRAQIGATQSALAGRAGIDQSRVSRIENGDQCTLVEVQNLLGALVEMGSEPAAEYVSFSNCEWQNVEKPSFSNPQRHILEFAEEALAQMANFLTEEDRPWPLKRQLERQRAAIQASASYLGRTDHQIAFIGEVGVGKSTAISFIYGLLDPTTTNEELKERVVLETGGGHTTLCEVNIRRGPSHGIVVQAQSDDEIRGLVADFCAAAWMRRNGRIAEKNDPVNVSEEVQRALRNMSGLTVKRERKPDGKTTSRDQAAELVDQCENEDVFRAQVLSLMKLESRTRREIWIEDATGKTSMQQLRKLFREINNGRLPDVPFPSSIDLLVPNFGSELAGLSVSAVDTKGLDELAIRADLDARLKDPRTHVVLCSTFNQAPSTSVQLLLEHLRNAHGIRVDTGKVSVLALPRDQEAMAVKDDAGEAPIDDEDGYQLKRDQILRTLASHDNAFSGVPINFFNVKSDDPATMRRLIVDQVSHMRRSHEERLLDECAAADEVVRNHEMQAFTAAVQAVADQLGNFLRAHIELPPRIRVPSDEVIEAMSKIRSASTIWAMTRRNGEYYNFSVSHHVGAGAAKDAMLRSKIWFDKLQGVIDTLKQDPDLILATKTIQQVESGISGWRRDFAESTRLATVETYRGPLEDDQALWSTCSSQWGAGPGFIDRVKRLLRGWFEKEVALNQTLEGLISVLWNNSVTKPLERLAEEGAGDHPLEVEPSNVVPIRAMSAVTGT